MNITQKFMSILYQIYPNSVRKCFPCYMEGNTTLVLTHTYNKNGGRCNECTKLHKGRIFTHSKYDIHKWGPEPIKWHIKRKRRWW